MKIESCVIFSSGICGTGKTTVFKKLAEYIDNGIYLGRDSVAQQILTIDPRTGLSSERFPEGLLTLEDYVKNDSVFPDNVFEIQTPFGPALQIGQKTAYNARHGINQCDLITYAIASDNLKSGKVPLIDSLTPKRFKKNEVEKIINSEFFDGFLKHIIYFFFSNIEEMRKRVLERGRSDNYVKTRVEYKKAENSSLFKEYVESTQADFINNFGNLPILKLDVLGKDPQCCVEGILELLSKEK